MAGSIIYHDRLLFHVYDEHGEPHHEPNVEVVYKGQSRSKGRGEKQKANIIVPYNRDISPYVDASTLPSGDTQDALDILEMYREKILEEWEVLRGDIKRTSYKTAVAPRVLKWGFAFWPVTIGNAKGIAVSYPKQYPPAKYLLQEHAGQYSLKLASPGGLSEGNLAIAEDAISLHLSDWMNEDASWRKQDSAGRQIASRWGERGAATPFTVSPRSIKKIKQELAYWPVVHDDDFRIAVAYEKPKPKKELEKELKKLKTEDVEVEFDVFSFSHMGKTVQVVHCEKGCLSPQRVKQAQDVIAKNIDGWLDEEDWTEEGWAQRGEEGKFVPDLNIPFLDVP